MEKHLPLEKYITSSCVISEGSVYKNGVRLFNNTEPNAAAFLTSVYQHFQFGYSRFYKMDNLSKLGWLASEVLLKDSFDKGNYKPEDIGLVLANRHSSLDDDLKYFDTMQDIASPALFVYTLPNIVIGEICIRNGFKGEHTFYIQNVFDAVFIEKQVSYLLDHDILQACICGWVDFLGDDYKAALFLTEKKSNSAALGFFAGNMANIFNNNR